MWLCFKLFTFSQKALSDSPYSVTYLGSEVRQVTAEVHEVLIVMELYEGTPVIDLLNQYLSSGRSLPEEKVVKIFLDVCQAVARLHHRTKPILHRDLKVCGEWRRWTCGMGAETVRKRRRGRGKSAWGQGIRWQDGCMQWVNGTGVYTHTHTRKW